MDLSELLINNINSLENGAGANFGQIFSSFLQQGVGSEYNYTPPIDLIDDGDNIIIYVDIPGINPNTVAIDFYNNKIEICGERTKPYNEFIKKEIIYGTFKRKITIPISVTNRDSVTVSASYGVLKININKTKEEKNKFSVTISEN